MLCLWEVRSHWVSYILGCHLHGGAMTGWSWVPVSSPAKLSPQQYFVEILWFVPPWYLGLFNRLIIQDVNNKSNSFCFKNCYDLQGLFQPNPSHSMILCYSFDMKAAYRSPILTLETTLMLPRYSSLIISVVCSPCTPWCRWSACISSQHNHE